jgi:hypothetical protein
MISKMKSLKNAAIVKICPKMHESGLVKHANSFNFEMHKIYTHKKTLTVWY